MIDNFDHWRERYDTLTFAEQQAYHNQIEEWYPQQAHFNYEAAKYAIETTGSFVIFEAGAWKGDLCKRIMDERFHEYPEHHTIWFAAELCPNAIEKRATDEITYLKIDRFDWWQQDIKAGADMFLATHFIEHLSDKHLTELLAWADGIRWIYLEAPISEHGQEWNGYEGTHKLTFGWQKVRELLSNYECEDINDTCKLFVLK